MYGIKQLHNIKKAKNKSSCSRDSFLREIFSKNIYENVIKISPFLCFYVFI